MRSKILTAFVATILPLSVVAQDDMYFVPTKEQVQAEKNARQKNREAKEAERIKQEEALRKAYVQQNAAAWRVEQVKLGQLEDLVIKESAQQPTYYSGINKSVDDYNRRKVSPASACDTTVYSKDSIASDIIELTPGNGYPQEVTRVDTVYKYVILDDDDYRYSRWMSRWDDYYWRWGWGYPGWYAGWHSPYSPWYDPFYDPWFYDPWYYRSWYGPGWYGPYWAYDPWYRPGWGGWYGPGYIGGGTVIIHDKGHSGWTRTGGAPSGTGNHAGWRYNGGKVYANNSHGSSSSNASIARRNGDGVNSNTGYTTRRNLNFNGSRTSYNNNESRMNTENYNRSSYSNSSSSSRSSGGSFSGGGHSGGGHSGGFSGGGSSGGGRFGGGRR